MLALGGQNCLALEQIEMGLIEVATLKERQAMPAQSPFQDQRLRRIGRSIDSFLKRQKVERPILICQGGELVFVEEIAERPGAKRLKMLLDQSPRFGSQVGLTSRT